MRPKLTGAIRGQVLRADGDSAVPNATVGVTRAAGPVPDIALVTDRSVIKMDVTHRRIGHFGQTGTRGHECHE